MSIKSKFLAFVMAGTLALATLAGATPSHAAGPVTRTADGFTFNAYDQMPSWAQEWCDAYAWEQASPDPVRGVSNGTATSSGLQVTVTGMAPGTQSAIFLVMECYAAERINFTVYGNALLPGSTPTFGSSITGPANPDDGVATVTQVAVTNFDPSFNYSVYLSGSGNASIDSSGVVSITGLSFQDAVNLNVSTSRSGYTTLTGGFYIPGQTPSAGLTPSFGASQPFAGGFSFAINNYNNAYIWNATSSAGQATLTPGTGSATVTVTGLSPSQSASVSVSTRKWGHAQSAASASGTAPEVLGTPSNAQGIGNANSVFVTWGSASGATSYSVTTTPGGATCTASVNYCTVTGLTNGQSYTFSVVAVRGSEQSAASVSPAVLVGPRLEVAGYLSSQSWKPGEAITANPLIVGQYSILRYQWYRCSSAIASGTSAPSCDAIGGATGASFTPADSDLGKFISAHLMVTGSSGPVGYTIPNSSAIRVATSTSTDAPGDTTTNPANPANPADPGKPSISNISNREISVEDGATIVLTGTGFGNVTKVQVNGETAIVVSSTATRLEIKIPAGKTTGLVNLSLVTAKETITENAAIAYVAAKPTVIVAKPVKRTLTGFVAATIKLSAKQKVEIAAFVKANPSFTKLRCVAVSTGVRKSTSEQKAAVARAKAACAYALTTKKALKASTLGSQGKTTGKVQKLVTLELSN